MKAAPKTYVPADGAMPELAVEAAVLGVLVRLPARVPPSEAGA